MFLGKGGNCKERRSQKAVLQAGHHRGDKETNAYGITNQRAFAVDFHDMDIHGLRRCMAALRRMV